MKIAICDDEKHYCKQIQECVEIYLDKHHIYGKTEIFMDGNALLEKGMLAEFDALFLDVEFGGKAQGMKIAREVHQRNAMLPIVFVSAFITYALEGYKVDAVRYLIKDHESLEKAMTECMDTILEKMDYEENEMTFDFQEGKTTISLENILYIESNLHRLIFYMAGEDAVHYTIYTKLDDVAELLQNKGFCRIHKSYLVNLKYVKSVERYRAVLSNGKSLAISKARFLDTRNEFACYRGEI